MNADTGSRGASRRAGAEPGLIRSPVQRGLLILGYKLCSYVYHSGLFRLYKSPAHTGARSKNPTAKIKRDNSWQRVPVPFRDADETTRGLAAAAAAAASLAEKIREISFEFHRDCPE